MTEDMIAGPHLQHCVALRFEIGQRNVASLAARLPVPNWLRKRRTASSAATSRLGGGSGIHRLS